MNPWDHNPLTFSMLSDPTFFKNPRSAGIFQAWRQMEKPRRLRFQRVWIQQCVSFFRWMWSLIANPRHGFCSWFFRVAGWISTHEFTWRICEVKWIDPWITLRFLESILGWLFVLQLNVASGWFPPISKHLETGMERGPSKNEMDGTLDVSKKHICELSQYDGIHRFCSMIFQWFVGTWADGEIWISKECL